MIGILSVSILAAVFDLKTGKVPNVLIILGLLTGLLYAFARGGLSGMLDALSRCLAIMAIFYLFFIIGTMGAGDVKLYALIPFYYDVPDMFIILVSAFCVGAIMAIIKIAESSCFASRIQSLTDYVKTCLSEKRLRPYYHEPTQIDTISLALPLAVAVLASVIATSLDIFPFFERYI